MAFEVHSVAMEVESVEAVSGFPHFSEIRGECFVGQLRVHDFGLAGERKIGRGIDLNRFGLVVSVTHVAVEFGS